MITMHFTRRTRKNTDCNAGRLLTFAFGFCFIVGIEAAEALPGKALTSVVDRYCVECHDHDANKGGLDLEKLRREEVVSHTQAWERAIRKLRARQMPPIGKPRPADREYDRVIAELSATLDSQAEKHPNPGRTDTFRRLNRTEYQNAIRDLLAVEVDVAALLPKDDASHGFDNVTVGNLSPTLLDRYISAAQKISRLAVGAPSRVPGGETVRIKPDVTQEEHVEGLPFGTRGGTVITHTFPRDGEYEVQVRLTRDRNEEIEGLREAHQVVLLLDRAEMGQFKVAPPVGNRNFEVVDAHLKMRIPVKAGSHQLGVTFVKNPTELVELKRQPYQAHFNMHRHPRLTPAVYQVSITGPYNSTGAGDTESRRRIFIAQPNGSSGEDKAAEKILSNLIRKAYRRPISSEDLRKPMQFYRETAKADGFEAGIEAALSAVLVSPEFLFRIERDPTGVASGISYKLDDVTLASRLSFFIWGSIPDEELLGLAERGELHKPAVLERQARRMLADARSRNLATNFAGQWLYLRNLESFTPDLRMFPDFDDNLRQAFREETELFVESVIRADRNVLNLLKADYTFLNERLAKHYGIPNVYGSQFRKVNLGPGSERGGLLRQGSVLTVTSYATRTSPVIRGHWILGNLLGSPPPPPPANVPALKENTVSSTLPMRERLAAHRANTACAGCHNLMDPVGFSLENFDAIGRWRTTEDGVPINASGGMPDGSQFEGVGGLEKALASRPELFVGTLTEKLLVYSMGRGIEPEDAPAVRKIVREARARDYAFSSLIVGIVKSTPFTMRRAL